MLEPAIKKQQVLVFGNPLLSFDSLPLKLKPLLEKVFPYIDFIEFEVEENIEDFCPNLVLIDSAFGIKRVKILNNLNSIEKTKTLSLHGFDLSLMLALLERIGKLKKITIIAVPARYSLNKAFKETVSALKSLGF